MKSEMHLLFHSPRITEVPYLSCNLLARSSKKVKVKIANYRKCWLTWKFAEWKFSVSDGKHCHCREPDLIEFMGSPVSWDIFGLEWGGLRSNDDNTNQILNMLKFPNRKVTKSRRWWGTNRFDRSFWKSFNGFFRNEKNHTLQWNRANRK